VTKTRGLLLCACALLACAAAGAARAGLDVGVTEDAGKTGDNGAAFFATLNDVGLKVNRVSINWNAANPTRIAGQDEIAAWLPQAQAAGTRIIFAVAPQDPHGLTATPGAKTQFAAFLGQLAATYPTVKDYVIGNEPNQPYFWAPQYSVSGKPLAAAQYLPVLAASYDALKATRQRPAVRQQPLALAGALPARPRPRLPREPPDQAADGRVRLPPVSPAAAGAAERALRLADGRPGEPGPDQAGGLGRVQRHRAVDLPRDW
jgi:hypothetical protein